MTADPPKTVKAAEQSKSSRNPSRSASLNSQHSRSVQSPTTSPSLPPRTPPLPKPQRPRSADSTRTANGNPRDQVGSSRTKYYASQPAHPTSPILAIRGVADSPVDIHTPPRTASIETASTMTEVDMDTPHAPYRPPEAVFEPPEELPPGQVAGIIAEHPISDDDMPSPDSSPLGLKPGPAAGNVDAWRANLQKYNMMHIDEPGVSPERPQIGPGILPRRWLQIAHKHDLFQPVGFDLPTPPPPKKAHTASVSMYEQPISPRPRKPTEPDAVPPPPSPTPSVTTFASLPSLPDYEHISTVADIWDACPGGEGGHHEWYFCPTCWTWVRIVAGQGELPRLAPMEEWEEIVRLKDIYPDTAELDRHRSERMREWSRFNDIKTSKMMAEETHHHMHEFTTLLEPTEEERIERIPVDPDINAFPHLTVGIDPDDPSWATFTSPSDPPRLSVSCSSDQWMLVDAGPVPGQLPVGLVNAFISEKTTNPGPGMDGNQSVNEALTLISTLLANALFKAQRGWVKLDNKRFQSKIGASVTSSNLLFQIGFGCRQEEDALRVGPLQRSDKVSQAEVQQMDRYMLRTWVEMSLGLLSYQQRNALPPIGPSHIQVQTLRDAVYQVVGLERVPKSYNPARDEFRAGCHALGITPADEPATIEEAYDLQIACDASSLPRHLEALDTLARAPFPGKERLQMKVATERSLDRYTSGDIQAAYARIGFTQEQVDLIGVEAAEAPESYILDLHKKAVQASSSPAERPEIAQALTLIGRERNSEVMRRLGRSGQTHLSVDEAYAALSAPRNSIDDGLIMQYEMAVGEYPGKTEHYRMCLDIIANAQGEERPGIKSFLETGSRQPDAPARKDIPVGLQNIGNTCYLNSILQYLYSVKPLRDAVLSFEQDLLGSKTPHKREVERSRRLVRRLRVLFLQLYKSEDPAVRPDEELAYLAITRPEVDQIVEPQVSVIPPLDSIPNMPSPSSTRIATPDLSPEHTDISLPPSPTPEDRERSRSILGKRASQDRDDSSRSSEDRARQKGGDLEDRSGMETPMEVDKASDDFELVPKPDREKAESPSAATEIAGLELKSPIEEKDPDWTTTEEPAISEDHSRPSPKKPPPLPPRPPLPARKDTLASGLRFGLQQDSAEVLINVLTQLELAFDPASAVEGVESDNLIRSLFSCKYRQQISYESQAGEVEGQTPVESVFVHPIIGVEEEGKDLSDCLAELYLHGADIEYEGKKGYMMDLMDEFPPMLYIQMRRSQYDVATGHESKTNTHIAFGQTLAMDRFLVNVDRDKRDESIELTREMVRMRTRLHQLKNHKPMPIPMTFQHVRESLSQLPNELDMDISSDFLDALQTEGEEVTVEINGLEDQLPALKRQVDALWEGEREYEYELVSVFMHRGKTSGAGHYWTYQAHLPDHGDRFFKYNDETVTEVPETEVLQDRTGSDANPALLCYVRKGKNLVDTLHREVLEKAEEGAMPLIDLDG